MRKLKTIILSTFSLITFALAALTVSSCEQDSCTVLNCQNGGRCNEGVCQCPEGYEGAECSETLANRYAGTYEGTIRCNYNSMLFPITADSVRINIVDQPNIIKLEIKAGNTSLQNFKGTIVNGNQIVFEPLISKDANGNVLAEVQAFVKFDGHLINLNLVTINKVSEEQQSCSFIGKKHIYE
ncbi:MAG TPA: calcium-binding EGF-like domain-containing protein [Edaphocola sp.]|nr:calcium-binding EGF-like domain-containing protein [Edaphocola sp.]